MRALNQASARYAILMVAGLYIVLIGMAEASQRMGLLDSFAFGELVQQLTTVASLSVGAVLGFYLASQRSESPKN